jgi:integrase
MLFNFAVKKGYIENNPASEVPSRRVDKNNDLHFYTDNEIDLIFEKLPHDWVDFFSFLLNTGLRLGECLNLTWDKVKIDAEVPVIVIASSKDWTTKTKNSRNVPLNDVAKNILIKQKEQNYKYVFSDNGHRIEKNKPLRELKKVLNKLEIKGDIHQLRHTFATNFISKNKKDNSIFDLGKVLGHSDTKTTLKYAHLSQEHLHETVKRAEKKMKD